MDYGTEKDKYFCPICNKNIFIENNKIRSKNRRVLVDVGMHVNTDGMLRLTKSYEDYRMGYFICPRCKKDVIVSEMLIGKGTL